jgi:hydroxyacylglutathione hydrolase
MPTKVQKFTFFPEMFGENTYVVSGTSKECVVVDPGCFHAHERKALLDYLEGENLVVKMVICTHLHIDHILGQPLPRGSVQGALGGASLGFVQP